MRIELCDLPEDASKPYSSEVEMAYAGRLIASAHIPDACVEYGFDSRVLLKAHYAAEEGR